MSRTYRHDREGDDLLTYRPCREADTFRCRHCKLLVGQPPSGGRQRNHCPRCLHSRHMDRDRPGDRASACRALMAPIGAFRRRNGEYVLVHRCLCCGVERPNRIAADDAFEAVLLLTASYGEGVEHVSIA